MPAAAPFVTLSGHLHAQHWISPAKDEIGHIRLQRSLDYLTGKLEKRHKAYQAMFGGGGGGERSAAGSAAAALKHAPLPALQRTREVLRLQVQLLRLWRDIHLHCLKLEIQEGEKVGCY
jgi:hypothetical protein